MGTIRWIKMHQTISKNGNEVCADFGDDSQCFGWILIHQKLAWAVITLNYLLKTKHTETLQVLPDFIGVVFHSTFLLLNNLEKICHRLAHIVCSDICSFWRHRVFFRNLRFLRYVISSKASRIFENCLGSGSSFRNFHRRLFLSGNYLENFIQIFLVMANQPLCVLKLLEIFLMTLNFFWSFLAFLKLLNRLEINLVEKQSCEELKDIRIWMRIAFLREKVFIKKSIHDSRNRIVVYNWSTT